MDERLIKVNNEKQAAINNSNNMYNQLLQDNQKLYDQQNQYANTFEQTQNDVLDKQLAFNTGLIEQQKEKAQQNFETESKKARNDYTAYTNPYGLQAEQFASRGLLNSGVSETAKLGGYNTYQNRLATANKVMQDAFTQYDNDINEARLNNDVQKAQNAIKKLELQVQFSESFYNNKSTLSQNQLSNNQNLDSEYFNRYNTEYNNIQAEKQRAEAIRQWEAEMAEKQRQYNESLAYQKQQDALAQANWEREYALAKKKASSSSASNYGTITNGSNSNSEKAQSSNDKKVSTVVAGNALGNIFKGVSNNKKVESIKTPSISTKEYKWYNENFQKSMSSDALVKKIAQGINSGKLSEKDGDNILKAYGLY